MDVRGISMTSIKRYIASLAIVALLISPLAYSGTSIGKTDETTVKINRVTDPGGWIGG